MPAAEWNVGLNGLWHVMHAVCVSHTQSTVACLLCYRHVLMTLLQYGSSMHQWLVWPMKAPLHSKSLFIGCCPDVMDAKWRQLLSCTAWMQIASHKATRPLSLQPSKASSLTSLARNAYELAPVHQPQQAVQT